VGSFRLPLYQANPRRPRYSRSGCWIKIDFSYGLISQVSEFPWDLRLAGSLNARPPGRRTARRSQRREFMFIKVLPTIHAAKDGNISFHAVLA
jgi:hypothetical protein